MSFKVQGRLYYIGPTQLIKDNFSKREFVVIYNQNPGEAYSKDQYLKFELILDKCSLLDKFREGENVEVFFNLQGREWINPKGERIFFNTLSAYNIVSKSPSGAEEYSFSSTFYENASAPNETEALKENDLPF